MDEWQPIETVPHGEIVSLRARFGDGGAVLIYPEARRVGFEWFMRGHDGYFHMVKRGTLPFVPLEWRRLERMRLEEAGA